MAREGGGPHLKRSGGDEMFEGGVPDGGVQGVAVLGPVREKGGALRGRAVCRDHHFRGAVRDRVGLGNGSADESPLGPVRVPGPQLPGAQIGLHPRFGIGAGCPCEQDRAGRAGAARRRRRHGGRERAQLAVAADKDALAKHCPRRVCRQPTRRLSDWRAGGHIQDRHERPTLVTGAEMEGQTGPDDDEDARRPRGHDV